MGTTKPHSVCQVNGAKKVTISPSNDEAQSCCANPLLLDPIALSGLPPVTIRASRKDKHLHSTPPRWLFRLAEVARQVTGSIRMPSLPPFTMSRSSSNPIPATPRVISPSPTPSESREASQEGYFGPVTRSARKKQAASEAPIDEEIDGDEEGKIEESEPHESAKDLWLDVRKANDNSRDKATSSDAKWEWACCRDEWSSLTHERELGLELERHQSKPKSAWSDTYPQTLAIICTSTRSSEKSIARIYWILHYLAVCFWGSDQRYYSLSHVGTHSHSCYRLFTTHIPCTKSVLCSCSGRAYAGNRVCWVERSHLVSSRCLDRSRVLSQGRWSHGNPSSQLV